MKITKYGHSCLLIEEAGVRLLTDPGIFSSVPESLPVLDAILLTHEHADHTQPELLKKLLANQPNTKILTNGGVGAVLAKADIPYQLLEGGQTITLKTVNIEAFGKLHEQIVPTISAVANTGYLVDKRLFLTGDAFTVPNQPVEILALPISAPWSKTHEVLEYAVSIKPKTVIPIHDGFLIPNNPFQAWVDSTLPEQGITVKNLELGVPTEF